MHPYKTYTVRRNYQCKIADLLSLLERSLQDFECVNSLLAILIPSLKVDNSFVISSACFFKALFSHLSCFVAITI